MSSRICGALQSPAGQLAQVDVNGNALVAGYTHSSLDGNANKGREDIFLMKFNARGVHLWTRQRGGEGYDEAEALQADWVRRPWFSNLFHGGKALDPLLRGRCHYSGGMAPQCADQSLCL